MAQSGFTPIQLYRSTTASAAPSPGNLADGELAINTNDGKLFYKDSGGNVQTIATKAGANGDVVGPASATDNGLVAFDGTTGKLVKAAGTVTIAQGGTNATTASAALSNLGGLPLAGGTLTGPTIVSVNSSSDALRITQTGAGNALVVEDSTNPDSTPFVINADGEVGIGTSTPSSALEVVGDITAPDQNSYLAASLTKPDIRPSLNLDFANVKALDPRITFTRASTATYYDGKTTAKAEENLFRYSQELDNSTAWARTGLVAITPNAANAPDGTLTADKIIPNTSATQHYFSASATPTSTQTLSIFAKADGYSTVILFFAVHGAYVTFDLMTGTIAETSGTVSGTITDVGNGWYRLTATTTLTTHNEIRYYVVNGSTYADRTVAGDGTSGVLFWGAQLEQRSAATAYTATTTQPITNYVPQLLTAASGVARFDHDPITCESLGLLIEEQRTNLLTYSEDFADAAWTKVTASVMANTNVAPDGTLTADKFIPNSGSSTSTTNVYQNVTKSAVSTTYAVSCYGKPGEFNSMRLYFSDAATAANRCEATYNLSTGVVSGITNAGTFSGASASMTAVGNGWYRCVLIATTSTETSVRFRVTGETGGTGDGYSGIYIWGAQLEEGAFPTSYIKTEGSQVTRSADAASMTGTNFSSWYRQDEGTIYSESSIFSNASDITLLAIDDGETTQANQIDVRSVNGTTYRARVRLNSTTVAEMISGTILVGSTNKLAFGYKTDDHAFSFNVQTILTDGSGTVPSTPLVRMRIGVRGNQNNPLSGTIKKLAYYPKRLTNAQLQALTR